MITRRRGRAMNQTEVPHLEEERNPVEIEENGSQLSEDISTEDMDTVELDLDNLFGLDDLNWTLDSNASSLLFDVGLSETGSCEAKGNDSRVTVSTSSSPHRISSGVKMKHRQNLSSSAINKNAIAARLNRLKKKEYVGGLERRVTALTTENTLLKHENCQLTKRVEELEDETRYLRAVLANESVLAQLLSRLSGENGMKLSSSLFQGPATNDHDYALPKKRVKVEEKETSAGVCLHVDKNHVSVEFCTKCAASASAALKM